MGERREWVRGERVSERETDRKANSLFSRSHPSLSLSLSLPSQHVHLSYGDKASSLVVTWATLSAGTASLSYAPRGGAAVVVSANTSFFSFPLNLEGVLVYMCAHALESLFMGSKNSHIYMYV